MLAAILLIVLMMYIHYIANPLLIIFGYAIISVLPTLLLLAILIKFAKKYGIQIAIVIPIIIITTLIEKNVVLMFLRFPITKMVIYYCWDLFTILAIFVNSYSLTLFKNLSQPNKLVDLDYIIVLGAGLKGTRVQPLLASRINKAIDLYRKHKSLKIIMSGGQGPDEDIAEGIAMAEFAYQQGVPMTNILMEVKSTNTHENIRNSIQLIPSSTKKVGIVTTYYHTLRALIIARELNLEAIVFGSQSSKNLLFVLNAYTRELLAYLFRRINWVLVIVTNYSIYHFFIHSAVLFEWIHNFLHKIN